MVTTGKKMRKGNELNSKLYGFGFYHKYGRGKSKRILQTVKIPVATWVGRAGREPFYVALHQLRHQTFVVALAYKCYVFA